jgi:hypothetical protein
MFTVVNILGYNVRMSNLMSIPVGVAPGGRGGCLRYVCETCGFQSLQTAPMGACPFSSEEHPHDISCELAEFEAEGLRVRLYTAPLPTPNPYAARGGE